jgi:hypothetical protein
MRRHPTDSLASTSNIATDFVAPGRISQTALGRI